MNVDEKTLLTILDSSVRETFQNFLGCDPEMVETIHDRTNNLEQRSISGSVAFLQKDFEGTLSIGFSRDSAIKLFKSFYQENVTSVDDARVTEGIAELANVIHGLVKEKLNLSGCDFQMCLPVVVIGRNHAVFARQDCPGLSILFKTEFGNFLVEVITTKSSEVAA
ncbi:MAG: chemotaxis protein CheX [Bdellovibrio sp.]